MTPIYVYAISDSLLPAPADLKGMGGRPVRALPLCGLSCLTSEWHGVEFSTLSREHLVRHLLVHQQVVEACMADHTVLPVKFGTLVENQGEVFALLRQAHSRFLNAISEIRGLVELDLAVTWDIDRVLREVADDADVVSAKAAAASEGQPSLEHRLLVGQTVKACLDSRREAYSQQVKKSLEPLSVASVDNALVSDRLAVNAAFLVRRPRQAEFEDCVRLLDDKFGNSIDFRLVGPLPPYSFASVELKRLSPDQVRRAKTVLRVEDGAPAVEVRNAYRRMAAAEQRNLESGDDAAKDRITELRKASELLLDHCRATDKSTPGHEQTAKDALFSVNISGFGGQEVDVARFGARADWQAAHV